VSYHNGFIRSIKLLRYSAVLTSYNAEATLIKAVNSIFEQEILPAEILIVDDFSSDSTFKVARELESYFPLVRVFQSSINLGVAHSRNFALQNIREQFAIFFDDDDVSLRNRASVHLEHFSLGADVSYVSSSKKYVNGYTVDYTSDDFIGTLDASDFAKRQLIGGRDRFLATPASCMAIRRDMALHVDGFDTGLRRLEDVDIAIRLASENALFAFSSQISVERFDLGNKFSKYEGISQKIILDKHGNLLTKQQFHDASLKVDLRDLYFNGQYIKLFLRILKVMYKNPKQLRYLLVGFRRVRHDWSKK
jgi:glycosyltransferase involved in cell wall biosynthesis